jgi:hypothetical protein
MPSPISSTRALASLAEVSTKLNVLSLPAKIMELKLSRSQDRIQQFAERSDRGALRGGQAGGAGRGQHLVRAAAAVVRNGEILARAALQ